MLFISCQCLLKALYVESLLLTIIIIVCSPEEAGRYLETYKVYENKPPDALLGQSEGDYLSKVMTYNIKWEVGGLHMQKLGIR